MRALFLVLVLLVLLLSCSLGQNAAPVALSTLPVGSALVADLKGDVSVQSAQGTRSPATKGLQIQPNTIVETGKGRVLLQLQDGTQVLVKDHSRVVLRQPEQNKGNFLEMLIGKVLASVRKRMNGEPVFKMGTPTAVITVRGTRFLVEVSGKPKTFVSVYDGLVEVLGLGPNGQPVFLSPGFSTEIEFNRPPEPPQRMLEYEGGGGALPSRSVQDRNERDGRPRGSTAGSGDTQPPEPHDLQEPEAETE